MILKRLTMVVLAIQLFGAAMFALVCAAYIFGLPNTVLHETLAFRVGIGFFGSFLFLGSLVLAVVDWKKQSRPSD